MPAALRIVFLLALSACSGVRTAPPPRLVPPRDAFVDTLQERTFRFFWETAHPESGLLPDRWPQETFSSVASVGFGLSAYLVGAERGYVTRAEAADRTRRTLQFLWTAPQGPNSTGVAGYRGFFYHFLDKATGERYRQVELSTIDTALLMAGVLSAGEYFDGNAPAERQLRALADSLYRRVEWDWFQREDGLITMAWHPEGGFGGAAYQGYDEAMILYLLALGSPTHPIRAEAWPAFTSSYDWATFYGQEHVNFAPLFGHQYSHVWVDFRGILDAYMRQKGIDYFENSRRATLSQRAYAQDNPMGWKGYGGDIWGLTASDGPVDAKLVIDGRERQFHTYWARGAAAGDIRDDGTLVPTAAGGSIPFAPEITIPALKAMRAKYRDHIFRQYGFVDAFNPTLDFPTRVQTGAIVPGVGWFDVDYLGIDQGPIVLMIENHYTGFLWNLMRDNPYLLRGLCRAGFAGGWLGGTCN